MNPLIKTVELPGGVRLPYAEQGDRAGIPVVLLHGYTDSWRSFERVLPHLPTSLHAFALTQRGHGDADRPPAGYRPQDFTADLAAFMDALDLGPAVVVGHSMGSYMAQRFALDYPERTLGLVLMSSSATVRESPAVAELRAAVAELADPVDPDFAREFQEGTTARPVPEAFFRMAVQESLKLPARVWRAVLEGFVEGHVPPEPGQIQVPTLIVWGDQDAMFGREEQEALAAAIPGAQLLVYRGTGHALHWEEPERFAADLARFAANLAR